MLCGSSQSLAGHHCHFLTTPLDSFQHYSLPGQLQLRLMFPLIRVPVLASASVLEHDLPFACIMEFCAILWIFLWSQNWKSELKYSKIQRSRRMAACEWGIYIFTCHRLSFLSSAADSVWSEVWIWPKMPMEYLKGRLWLTVKFWCQKAGRILGNTRKRALSDLDLWN